MNGVIIDSKVYEAVERESCNECDFDNNVNVCKYCRDLCFELDCAFRLSETLTDKINDNEDLH